MTKEQLTEIIEHYEKLIAVLEPEAEKELDTFYKVNFHEFRYRAEFNFGYVASLREVVNHLKKFL